MGVKTEHAIRTTHHAILSWVDSQTWHRHCSTIPGKSRFI